MKTAKIGKIKETLAKIPRSRFNFAHDVNTTAGFGDLQPLQCKMLIPGSKTTCSVESLVRMSPLVRPCFGRIKYKMWHSFVGMSDLLPQFTEALLAGTTISRGSSTFVPSYMPHMPLGVLSLIILTGAKMTHYYKAGGDSDSTLTLQNNIGANDRSAFGASIDTQSVQVQFVQSSAASRPGLGFNFGKPINNGFHFGYNTSYPIWIGLNVTYNASTGSGSFCNPADVQVPIKSADYVIGNTDNSYTNYYAFELSSFGKRLRKILLGCGYQIDFTSTAEVSLMPLFAYFKAYFDSFGLCLYDNWESTNCAKLLSYIDYNNKPDVFANYGTDSSFAVTLSSFFADLGSCFVTEEQNFVSAHMRSPTVSSGGANNFFTVVADPDGTGNPSLNSYGMGHSNTSNELNTSGDVGHIVPGTLSYLQIDALKKLYLWTNRNTMAGRKIADLLRAQGFGDYVDSCKSNFIGYDEVDINISDVLSQSDTFDAVTSSGRELGDYAGKGIGYNKTKTLSFENNEFGFWVTLCSVVPSAGYSQAMSQDVLVVSKYQFYSPDFDGLGYEVTPKCRIVGAVDWSSNDSQWLSPSASPFGFIARYSGFKTVDNLFNGDFSLRGTRAGYLPFTADRYIDITEREITGTTSAPVMKTVATPNDLPTAGNVWRYTARYPWLSNYNRIFSRVGLSGEEALTSLTSNNEYQYNLFDNFLVHNIVNMQCYAPMKPIEESFGTIDDDYGANASTEKR